MISTPSNRSWNWAWISERDSTMPLNHDTITALQEARVQDPFSLLGLHREGDALWARIWLRRADEVTLMPADGGKPVPLTRIADGLFEARIPGRKEHFAYDVQVRFQGEKTPVRVRDVYSFWPQLPEFDLGLFQAGHHLHLGDLLGAHVVTIDG